MLRHWHRFPAGRRDDARNKLPQITKSSCCGAQVVQESLKVGAILSRETRRGRNTHCSDATDAGAAVRAEVHRGRERDRVEGEVQDPVDGTGLRAPEGGRRPAKSWQVAEHRSGALGVKVHAKNRRSAAGDDVLCDFTIFINRLFPLRVSIRCWTQPPTQVRAEKCNEKILLLRACCPKEVSYLLLETIKVCGRDWDNHAFFCFQRQSRQSTNTVKNASNLRSKF